MQANDTTLPTLSTESIGELLVLLTQLLLCPWAAAAIATDAQLLSMLSTEARVLAEEVSLDTADGVSRLVLCAAWACSGWRVRMHVCWFGALCTARTLGKGLQQRGAAVLASAHRFPFVPACPCPAGTC